MTTCPGCSQPLEPLAQVRTYHTQCDPQGRVEMLERELRNVLEWARVEGIALRAQEIASIKRVLEYRPAQMKRREG